VRQLSSAWTACRICSREIFIAILGASDAPVQLPVHYPRPAHPCGARCGFLVGAVNVRASQFRKESIAVKISGVACGKVARRFGGTYVLGNDRCHSEPPGSLPVTARGCTFDSFAMVSKARAILALGRLSGENFPPSASATAPPASPPAKAPPTARPVPRYRRGNRQRRRP
jgi:hypothetical protein